VAILFTNSPPRRIKGRNRNSDIGYSVTVPKGEVIHVEKLSISNVFIGLVKYGEGQLLIDELSISSFGGDAINLRSGNVHIRKLTTYRNTPTRPYYSITREGDETIKEALSRTGQKVHKPELLEWNNRKLSGYHQDAILQAYSTKDNGYEVDDSKPLTDVYIDSLHAVITGSKTQGIMLSEACHNLRWAIGIDYLYIKSDYPYPIVMNTGAEINIGNRNASMTGSVKVKNVKGSTQINRNINIVGVDHNLQIKEERKVIPTMTLKQHAERIGVEYEALQAIAMQEELKGRAFRYGMPTLLFECHIFTSSLRKRGISPNKVASNDRRLEDIICTIGYRKYGSYRLQKKRYELAKTVNRDAAIEACSWGMYQVLGVNYEMCGYSSPSEFREAADTREGQLDMFVRYLESRKGLIDALKRKDWSKVKKLYQGKKFIDRNHDGRDDYTAGLVRNYTRAVQRNNPRKPLSKSRTMRNNATSAVTKAVVGGSVLAGSGSIIDGVREIKGHIDSLSELKDEFASGISKIEEVTSGLGSIQAKLQFVDYLPYVLGVILILAIIPNIKIAMSYMQDNGYRDD